MKSPLFPHILAGIVLLIPSVLLAKPDFKLNGRINLELESKEQFSQADLDKEAVLELATRRKEGFQGEVDARVTSDSGTLELREIFLEYESASGNKLMIGQHRKRFGLDWDYKLEERIILNRSILNEKLTKLSYVGRDTIVRYLPEKSEDSSFAHDLSFHTANGLNAALLYGVKWWLSSTTFVGSTTLGQLNRVGKRSEYSFGQTFSFSKRNPDARLDAEFFLGEDHLETEFHDLARTPRTVLFSALQAMTSRRLGRHEPFLRVGAVANDISALSNSSLELTAGSRLYFLEGLYFGVQLQLKQLLYGHDRPDSTESEGLAVLRYFF